ncbi:FIG00857475: hypothetical protein [hydrothermal vent metagenome]|uniref:VWA domain-containing protein n=1 Tax=hydrothermal vent metagenome TaxID=652676 RepID=A0A3B1BCV4_9ZZZZ
MSNSNNKLPKQSANSNVAGFLQKVAKAPIVKAAVSRGRLIFAMDATASRGPTWESACQIQSRMFEETAALGGLDIQLCYYRGQAEFSASPWLTRSDDLKRRMSEVYCVGGMTQIGQVLRHALRETAQRKVNALVFVGDCVEESVDGLCQQAGELGMRGVPLFLFQEGQEPTAEKAFRQMAQLTDGAYCHFDVGSARQLADLLSAVAVYAAGGQKALVDYEKRHGKLLQQSLKG